MYEQAQTAIYIPYPPEILLKPMGFKHQEVQDYSCFLMGYQLFLEESSFIALFLSL